MILAFPNLRYGVFLGDKRYRSVVATEVFRKLLP